MIPVDTGFTQSVQARLKNEAKETGRPFTQLLELYAVERFIHRLGRSEQRARFVLKGAQLLRLWLGTDSRPTRDIDLYGPASLDPDGFREALIGVLHYPVEEDALHFEASSLVVQPIRGQSTVLGLRAKLNASLGRIRIRCQIDAGLGDSIFPAPETIRLPGLLDLPVASVRAYTPYTTVAEKLEAIVVLGLANSRMKDYYDLLRLSEELDLDGPTLVETLCKTFARRETPIPQGTPDGLGPAFFAQERVATQWLAFLRKGRLDDVPLAFETVVKRIARFARPVFGAAAGQEPPLEAWPAGGPWR